MALSTLVSACSDGGSAVPSRPDTAIAIASEFPLPGFQDAQRAVQAAIDEHRTVRGYRLAFVSRDDSLGGRWDRDRARQNAKLLVRDRQILGVVGPASSAAARLVIPVAAKESLVMVGLPDLDCLTARPKACFQGAEAPATANNFFRVVARKSVAARGAADFAMRTLGIKRFAVLVDDFPGAVALGEAFGSQFELMGGKVVFRGTYSTTASTYASLLRDARAAGAEAVYVGWGVAEIGTCKLREAMYGIFPDDAYLISGDNIGDAACIKDAGSTANEHLVATISARMPATLPAALKGTSYSSYSYAAYDSAKILIAAIERAIVDNGGKVPTREQVLKAMAATKEYKGITGTYSFDANGDAIQPGASFTHVSGGVWKFWQNIN